ncbi:methionyl-tRNA formyltransferase [Eubacteriales bacterium KG127]
MNVVFMGTPEFAAESLRAIIEAGHNVELVVTQPDKQKNRGKKVVFSPVKELAIENDIKFIQPQSIKSDKESIEILKKAHKKADLGIVVAYGQILSKEILDMPKLGYINVHGSLLPKLRGASPIQTAILLGEDPTGVTIMRMEEGLDSGPMYSKVEVPVGSKTAVQLEKELAIVGGRLLVDTVNNINSIVPEKQNNEEATFCTIIRKSQGHIDFSKSAEEIERMARAYDSWPGTFASIGEHTYKIWKFDVLNDSNHEAQPGEILKIDKNTFIVACGERGKSRLSVTEIQAPGKKRMSSGDFIRGNKLSPGEIFR